MLGALLCGVFPVVAAIGRCMYIKRRKARHVAQQNKRITPGNEARAPSAASTGTTDGHGHATSAGVAARSADTGHKDLSSCGYAPQLVVAGASATARTSADHVDDDGEQEVKRELRYSESRPYDVASSLPRRGKRGEDLIVDVAGPAAHAAQPFHPAPVSTVSTTAMSDDMSAAAAVSATGTTFTAWSEPPEGGGARSGGGRCYSEEEGVHCNRQADDVAAVPSNAAARGEISAVNTRDNSGYPDEFVIMTLEEQKSTEGIATPTPDAAEASAAPPAAEPAAVTAVGEAAHANIKHLVNDSSVAECLTAKGSTAIWDGDGAISRVVAPDAAAVTTVKVGGEINENEDSDRISAASGDLSSGEFAIRPNAYSYEAAAPTAAHVHVSDPTLISSAVDAPTIGPRPALPEAAERSPDISAASRASMPNVALPILDVSSVAVAGVHAYSESPAMAWSTCSDCTTTADSPHNSEAAAVFDGTSNNAPPEESGAGLMTSAAVAAAISAARESIYGDDGEGAVSTTGAAALATARVEVHSPALVGAIAPSISHSVTQTVRKRDDGVRIAGTAADVGTDHEHVVAAGGTDVVNVGTEEGLNALSTSGQGGGLIGVHNFAAIREDEEETAVVCEQQEDMDAVGISVCGSGGGSGDGFDITRGCIDPLRKPAEHYSGSGIGLAVGGIGHSDDDGDDNSDVEDVSGYEGDAHVSTVNMEKAVVGEERGREDLGARGSMGFRATKGTQSRR